MPVSPQSSASPPGLDLNPSQQGTALKHAQRKDNLRLGLVLASVAATFFLGFIAKMVLLRTGHL